METWKRHLVAHALVHFFQRYGRAELRPAHVLLAKFWRHYARFESDMPSQRLEVAAQLLYLAASWEALTGNTDLYDDCKIIFQYKEIPLPEAVQTAMNLFV